MENMSNENANQANSILDLIKNMSEDETNKLISILAGMLEVEKQNKRVMSQQETAEFSADWLRAQKVTGNSHNILLSAVSGRHSAKIHKQKLKINKLQRKTGNCRAKITAYDKTMSGIQEKIDKLESKISRNKISNRFLQSVSDEGHSSAVISVMFASNERKLLKATETIQRLKDKLEENNFAINKQNAKISVYTQKIDKRTEKIAAHEAKLNRISDIEKLQLPNAALSYFIADRAGMNFNELNKFLENSVEAVKPLETETPTERVDTPPSVIEETVEESVQEAETTTEKVKIAEPEALTSEFLTEGFVKVYPDPSEISEQLELSAQFYDVAPTETAVKNNTESDAVKLLNTMAKFPHYSFKNNILIAEQSPDAIFVAQKKSWEKHGRTVNENAKEITILAPKDKSKNEFESITVYDISQTKGKPFEQTLPNYGNISLALRELYPDIAVKNKNLSNEEQLRAAIKDLSALVFNDPSLTGAVEYVVLAHYNIENDLSPAAQMDDKDIVQFSDDFEKIYKASNNIINDIDSKVSELQENNQFVLVSKAQLEQIKTTGASIAAKQAKESDKFIVRYGIKDEAVIKKAISLPLTPIIAK